MNKFFLILSSLILCLFIGSAGFYFGYKLSNQQNDSPDSTITQNMTSNLKLYRNLKYGFSLEYPPDWIITKARGTDRQTILNLSILPIADPAQSSRKDKPGIYISLLTYEGQFMDWLENGESGFDKGPFFPNYGTTEYESSTESINGYQTFYYKQITEYYVDENYSIANGKGEYLNLHFREIDKSLSPSTMTDRDNDFTQYIPVYRQVVNSIRFAE